LLLLEALEVEAVHGAVVAVQVVLSTAQTIHLHLVQLLISLWGQVVPVALLPWIQH
jgi:hypothetical protein